MSRLTTVFAFALLASAMLLTAFGLPAAGQQAPEGEGFEGKVLAISCRANSETGAILEGVRVRKLADQSFLVGKAISLGGAEDWQKGRIVWVAVGDISQIVEFPSVDAYREAALSARPELDKAL